MEVKKRVLKVRPPSPSLIPSPPLPARRHAAPAHRSHASPTPPPASPRPPLPLRASARLSDSALLLLWRSPTLTWAAGGLSRWCATQHALQPQPLTQPSPLTHPSPLTQPSAAPQPPPRPLALTRCGSTRGAAPTTPSWPSMRVGSTASSTGSTCVT
eukprot:scaffold55217_cov41-Phaeocystis_antarctica.AAC.1